MNGSGCKKCPAYEKCTAQYRGSVCAAIRDSYGLGDPITNEDRIRAMSDEKYTAFLFAVSLCSFRPWCDFHCMKDGDYGCEKCIERWLKQPAEEET